MAIFDKLFELIKSLTKQEKIYFKTYAKGSKGNTKKYIQLFDAIANQKEYNEQKIRKQFKNEQFIKQLPVAKDYLYKMIMKALRNFDNFNPLIHIVLQKMLHDVNILYDKALYHSCEKVIIKAKKLAEESEQFLYLSYILDWERKILLSQGESLEKRKKIQGILTAQTIALEKEKNTILFRDLFDNLSAIAINNLSVRDNEKRQILNELMAHPLLENIDMATGFLSKLNFYNIHHLYNKLLRNRPQSITYSSQAVKLFELKEHKLFLTEYKERYCSALISLIIDQAWMGKENEFDSTLNKFNAFLSIHPELKVTVFPRTYIARALLLEHLGKYDEISILADDFEKEFSQFKGEISKERLILVYYNFACLYMLKQDYREALRWLNKVLNDSTKELLRDTYCTARILNLIIHYELGNNDLLESLTRSTYRYLLREQSLYKFENTLIDFIRIKLPKVNNHENLIEKFKDLKKKFVTLSKDDNEKPVMDAFDFISWLESKIENRAFTEIVKEKVNG